MALDETAKEKNVRDSLKKYFLDSLYTAAGKAVTFDRYLDAPDIRNLTEWVSVNFGGLELSELSSHMLTIYPCTRSDPEGDKLVQLRDTIMAYLTDNAQTDGMTRITLYRSDTWTQLDGGFIIQQPVIESQQFEADDGTKYKILTPRLRFSTKV